MATRRAGATPATTVLERAGTAHRVHRYAHDPRAADFGAEAVRALAEALDVAAARVLKTLVLDLGTGLGVAVVPVPARADLKACAHALGVRRAELAQPRAAERATGYVVGGISPLGQRRSLPTVVDASALTHPTVLVSGGRRGLEVELDPAELVRLTAAVTAPVCA
ncbi:aminoacyl-tRNA deacylase [Rhodococcus aerolatus]